LLLIVLGGIWYFYYLPEPLHVRTFPATIVRECAPWDGAAFAKSVRYDSNTTITIFIWQSPYFTFPVTFSFPDATGRLGLAYSVMELDPLEELTGEVWFKRIEQGTPVEGNFNLSSQRGKQYEGQFVAEWGNQAVYCG
jgi:hypothetical protein